jgi:predicted phage-related endonuclease
VVAKNMELKDVILSTLAEMENETTLEESSPIAQNSVSADSFETEKKASAVESTQVYAHNSESELNYLKSIRERLLVLFEGFQAPNNTNIEAKIDMTLNFLEYTLATIDERVEKLEKGEDT